MRSLLTALTALALAAPGIVAASASEPPSLALPACIAIALPAVQGVEGNAVDVGGAVRDLLTSYLSGPSIQVASLEARLASQALEEARRKGCGHVLITTLTRKRSSGGSAFLKVLGQAGSSVAWQIPGAGVGAGVARGVAIAGAQAVSVLASSTKARDQMRIEYRLTSVDGRTTLESKEEKAKASVDGEDLLIPLVQRAAKSVAAAVTKK